MCDVTLLIFFIIHMNPEIEGDVELYVVTDVFWQRGTNQNHPRQNLPDKTPANNWERFCTWGFCPALFVLL